VSNLDPILRPRSLAVIGVSSKTDSLSGRLFANLFNAGYTGPVYPVNPKAGSIRGLKCYPAVAAIPDAVDLAIVMVPRDAVLATLDECLAAGVRGVVVITAGFREGGPVGAEVERQLLDRVRSAGVRMIGPNCMGLINTAGDVRLDATFSPVPALPGSVAFASHSGALGVAVLETAHAAGLGFAQFVSLGNSSDLNACDVLEAWEHDDAVGSVMLYLEALEEPRRFLEIARRITPRKPIVALKAGRSAAGQRAASSHTGALAAADTGVDAILKQAGVIRATTLEEMLDLARVFAACPLPRGRRVAILTNAGGPAIAASDALDGDGLQLAALSDATRGRLRAFLPAEASVGNPVDMLPSGTSENFRQAVELLAHDEGVDAVLTITVTPPMFPPAEVARGIAAATEGAGVPVLSVFMTNPGFHREVRSIPTVPPMFRYPEAAVRALAGMVRHAEHVKSLATALPGPARRSPIVERSVAGGGGFLAAEDAFALLAEAGLPVAAPRAANVAGDLAAVARSIGFPLVLKAFGPGLVHKSELGAVAVGLRDEGEVEAARAAMAARLAAAGVRPEGFLLQRMVAGGREVILGITRDPQAGALVMCGLGGVAVEALRDVAFRPAPLSADDAEAMLGELRGKALLGAFRGREPADRAALVGALVALGAVAAAHPEIAECDVNPLILLDEGQGCVAVDVRVRIEG
jgi:acetyl coenzyme A synthetase (ADP forming)-like protein